MLTASLRTVAALVVGALLVAAPSALGQPLPGAGAELSATLEEIEETMASWEDLRAQTIEVQDIEGLKVAATADPSAQLDARLKSLLTKKRSNREWKGYWEGERDVARRLLEAYAEIAPEEGEGPLDALVDALEERRDAAAERLATARRELERQRDVAAAAARALTQVREANTEAMPELEAQVEVLRQRFTRASEPIPRLEARVEAAAEGAAHDRAEEALAAAVAERDAADEALSEAREARDQAEALDAFLAAILDDDGPAELPPAPEADPETMGRITAYQQAVERRAAAESELEEATEEEEAASVAFGRALTLRDGFRDRRPALQAWAELAGDKVDNQDVYLEAIDADIAAVEERVRGLAPSPEETEARRSSAGVCDAERRADQSPLEAYNACVDATVAELRHLRLELDDVGAAALMNQRQMESLETLQQAQEVDVKLAVREYEIARTEAERAEADDETERWRVAWSTYRDRADGKREQLGQGLQSTKDTRRTLNVNEAFFTSEEQTLRQRIAQLEALEGERAGLGRLIAALAETAWHFIRNAYMVPVFLLLAWLLLWFARRVERRLVASATEDAKDRDEAQRVETLAVVARGGVKLVVYVATALLCLESVGIDTGPILGGAAIFGLAISFGSQSLVKDFVTGFFILLENQYAVGDVIEINGESGVVEAITLRRTILRDLQGRVHTIPNGSITNVINMTQGWSRVLMHVGVSYGTDLDHVEEVINRLGDEIFEDPEWSDKLEEPPRYIGMVAFGDSALMLRIMFKTAIFEQWACEREFNYRVKKAFDAEGIAIPFPQRDLHIMTTPPAGLLGDKGGPAGEPSSG